jgi:hypothetical protein
MVGKSWSAAGLAQPAVSRNSDSALGSINTTRIGAIVICCKGQEIALRTVLGVLVVGILDRFLIIQTACRCHQSGIY